MINEMRQVAERLAMKYHVSEIEIFKSLKDGVSRGLSLKACEISIRMYLGSAAGGNKEFFTIGDMMEVTGETREEIIKRAEQVRQEAIARGENPDNYIIKLNPEKFN